MKRLPIGTFVNMATIAVGSMIGLMLQQVLPENIQAVVFQALALGILIIGVQMALKLKDEMLLIFIFSLMIGGILGEILGVKIFLDSCEIWIKNNFYFSCFTRSNWLSWPLWGCTSTCSPYVRED